MRTKSESSSCKNCFWPYSRSQHSCRLFALSGLRYVGWAQSTVHEILLASWEIYSSSLGGIYTEDQQILPYFSSRKKPHEFVLGPCAFQVPPGHLVIVWDLGRILRLRLLDWKACHILVGSVHSFVVGLDVTFFFFGKPGYISEDNSILECFTNPGLQFILLQHVLEKKPS